MSGDELAVLIFSLMLGLSWLGVWYVTGVQRSGLAGGSEARRVLFLTPPVALSILFLVLRTLASSDVRDSAPYLALYLVFGLAWMGVHTLAFTLLGIDWGHDAIERRNLAAAVAIAGAMIGVLLCFAGGNIGDGPGWWVVLFCALLSTTTLFALWFIHEKATDVAETITVDRDLAAGLRLAAFLVASGAILGRAVAGDWVTGDATLRDFAVVAWPVLLLLVLAIAVERVFRPTVERPSREIVNAGVLPSLVYVAAAASYVFLWLERP